MNRLDRLQAILLQIQSKNIITAKEIADRFDISIRTVYRDIRALEEAGVPIGAEAGVGYFLDDNYNLPPIMFTHDEASALLLGGKFIPHMADKKVEYAFQEALMKVKAVMRTDQRESLEKLENSVKVYSGLVKAKVHDSIYLQDIQNALVAQQVIEIEYFSFYKQEKLKRFIEPVGLLHYAGNWHLIAYCRLRSEYRDFRLDRIKGLKTSEEKYSRQLDKSFEEYLENEKKKLELYEITLNCSQEREGFIQQSKYWYGFINESKQNEVQVMNFLNPDLDGFARWVISLGKGVKVEKPAKLNDIIIRLVKDLSESYL